MQFNYEAARKAGYTDEQIKEYLAQKAQAVQQPAQAPVMPSTEQVTQDMNAPSLQQKVGQGLADFIGGLAKPFVTTGSNIVGGAVQTPIMLLQADLEKRIADPTKTDKEKEMFRKQADVLEKWWKNLGVVGRTEQGLQEASQRGGYVPDATIMDKILGKGGGVGKADLEQQARASAGVASWAVPFGKGANFLTKATLPGAVVGGLQTASQDNTTPTEMLGGAALGGVASTGLYALSKIPGLLRKAGEKTEQVGGGIRSSNRKIQVDASIRGAGREAAINKTLDKLGIQGTPAQQYTQLEEKMGMLGEDIQKELARNPQALSRNTIKDQFMKNLESSLRLREMTEKQAKNAIYQYLDDIAGRKLENTVTDAELYTMKQMVNKDATNVFNKLNRGAVLTPTDRVVLAARQTFDEVLTAAHPKVKELTTMQSHLYDAAESLARSRNTVPTARIAGSTIPAGVASTGKEILGRTLQGVGRLEQSASGLQMPQTQAINQVLGAPLIPQIAGQVASRSLLQGSTQPQPEQQGQQTPMGAEQSPLMGATQPQKTVTGYSVEKLTTGLAQAIMANDNASASKLKQLLELESNYKKSLAPPKLSLTGAKDKAMISSGIRGVEELTSMLQENPNILATSFLSKGLLTRKYENAAFRAAESILRMRTGAVVNPKEAQNYAKKFLPWFGDDAETIKYKMEQASMDYEDLRSIYFSEEQPQ